jgi:hypothetical protein
LPQIRQGRFLLTRLKPTEIIKLRLLAAHLGPCVQFHLMPDKFHFMPDEFHYMPDKFHLMPDPTQLTKSVPAQVSRLLNERSFSIMQDC